jgi:hypothetical protein
MESQIRYLTEHDEASLWQARSREAFLSAHPCSERARENAVLMNQFMKYSKFCHARCAFARCVPACFARARARTKFEESACIIVFRSAK